MRNCKLRYLYFDRGCNMITTKIGNRIRELRTKTGLSQEKFAQKIVWIEHILQVLNLANAIFLLLTLKK